MQATHPVDRIQKRHNCRFLMDNLTQFHGLGYPLERQPGAVKKPLICWFGSKCRKYYCDICHELGTCPKTNRGFNYGKER